MCVSWETIADTVQDGMQTVSKHVNHAASPRSRLTGWSTLGNEPLNTSGAQEASAFSLRHYFPVFFFSSPPPHLHPSSFVSLQLLPTPIPRPFLPTFPTPSLSSISIMFFHLPYFFFYLPLLLPSPLNLPLLISLSRIQAAELRRRKYILVRNKITRIHTMRAHV